MSLFTRQETAAQIMMNVMNVIGLTPPAGFIGTTDVTVTQMVALFNEAGKDMASSFDWQMLHKEWTLVADGVNSAFDLPADWGGFVDSAGWDNTQRWPALGSISPQIWRMLKSRVSGGSWAAVIYKVQASQIVFFNKPVLNETFVFDYYGRGWLRATADPSIVYDNLQADSDICLLDSRLMESFLKLRWKGNKGFDTTNDVSDFTNVFEMVTGRNVPGPTLSIAPTRSDNLLGYLNIPDTGYGN